MKTIALASAKGGVGKTTAALNLGFAFARKGWRTLVIDADPQGGIGLSISPRLAASPGLFEHLTEQRPLSNLLVPTRLPEFSLLPVGHIAFQEVGAFHSGLEDGSAMETVLVQLEPMFDVVLLDTPGGLSTATIGCIRAADYLVTPMQAEPLALRALTHVIDLLGMLREEGRYVELVGILLTMVLEDDPVSMEVVREVVGHLPEQLVLRPFVPEHPAFRKASAAGVPLGLLSRRPPPVAAVFDELASALEERIDLTLTMESSRDEPIPLLV